MVRSKYIEAKILEKYKSVRQFSKEIGIPYTTLKSALDKENGIGTMAVEKALKIFSALGIDANNLEENTNNLLSLEEKDLINNYRMLNSFNRATVNILVERMVEGCQTVINTIQQPIYHLAVSAGPGQFLDSDNFDIKEFPEEVVPKDSTFAVKVSGDSMETQYPDGSIVFVKRAKILEPGEVGIFVLNGEGFIKELGKDCNLISYNPKYKDIIIKEDDDLRVVGKVIGEPYIEK